MGDEERDDIEVEFLPGLGAFVLDELDELFGGKAVATQMGAGSCRLAFTDPSVDRSRLLGLRTAVAVHLVAHFDVPRPKALLGYESFRRLTSLMQRAMEWTHATYASFRVSAAGRDSAVFQRLTEEIARATELELDHRFGDLLIRFRKQGAGWDATARTTPRPLAARAWRTHNYRGALNATIAAAMVRGMPERTSFVNLMCGSGTLLREYSDVAPGADVIGIDIDDGVLTFANDHAPSAALLRADVRRTPLARGGCGALAADLPYGQAVGSHGDNDALYAEVLRESARIAAPGAPFSVITHDIRRFRNALARQDAWRTESEHQVFQKGHNPVIWQLRRA